ncbi:MAG TPA: hypothetical protein VFM25_00085, partial [Verrucomicrobiae bacterium]|nr:hypothetical protein [Verrucomicrobiae bacterium]
METAKVLPASRRQKKNCGWYSFLPARFRKHLVLRNLETVLAFTAVFLVSSVAHAQFFNPPFTNSATVDLVEDPKATDAFRPDTNRVQA